MRISRSLVVSTATLGLLVAACDGAITTIGPSGTPDVAAPAASTDAVKGTVSASKPGSHAIGGTVAGLSGRGLVLQVNGGGDVAVGENGTFVFPAKLAKGSAFGVTVKTQPSGPNQLCVLGGDTGIVGDADVKSVTVDCFTDRYIVGGTVSGVSGSGVLLQLNGGNDVRVSNAGTFAFPAPLASHTLYTATVKANPTSPAQTCAVTGALGMVGDGPVKSIVVTCKTDEYALSGATSGYAGKGLVLHDAVSNEDLPVGADGTFKFTSTVPSKGSFDVSVKTQPSEPTQACSISGGQGTNVSGDVSSVVVNCSTKSFAVGGTASGVAGSATLVFNGVDHAISANGSFALGTLASGTPYAATLKAKPQSPSQTCDVTHGSGTVGGGAVTDIGLSCTTDRFTISGTLTGATGGVGLENAFDSDDEIFVLNGDGTFTFSKSVPSGENYLVGVKAGPATQNCTVGGPSSGKMGNGNVTGVTVTCVDKIHSVGGTVTGLAVGDTIELANGADTKTVTMDGSFVFDAKVFEGDSYNVTVKTAPTTNSLCTVTNGSHTMGSTDVGNVTVSCEAQPSSSGNYAAYPGILGSSANLIFAGQVTITSAQTVRALGIITGGDTGGNIKLALYTDAGGRPGSLVVESAGTRHIDGRIEIPVTDTPVAAGDYWIAFNTDAGFNVRFSGGSGPTAAQAQGTNAYASSFPGTGPTSTMRNWLFNVYTLAR